MPMRPPRTDSVSASIRNWARMSPPAGADGLADADLAGPLADRDQHDVHDPDAADDERDRGDAAEQQGERPADRRWRSGAAATGRRSRSRRCRSAASSWRSRSSARDVGLDRGHLRLVGDADADRADAVAGHEVLLDDPDRHQDLVVGILEAGPALGLEDADQLERQPADRDLAADGARVELEVVRGRGAEHRDPQVLLDGGVGEEASPARRRRRGPSA